MAHLGARGSRLKYSFHCHCAEGMIELAQREGKLSVHTKEGTELLAEEPRTGEATQYEIEHVLECIESGLRPITDGRSMRSRPRSPRRARRRRRSRPIHHVTRAVLPHLRGRGSLIVYVSSAAVQRPDVSGVAYQASKHGVVGLAHGTRQEEKANGVRTTVIFPDLTDSPLLSKRPTPTPPEIVATVLQPQDVAAACLFVATLPARAYVPERAPPPATI